MNLAAVTRSRIIAAPAEAIFAVLSDPRQHALIDGSGSVRGVRAGAPDRLYLGARFAMDMKIGGRYRITNEVVEFDPDRVIAWRHFNGHIWRYTLAPARSAPEPPAPGGGCVPDGDTTLVTEQWDPAGAKHQRLLSLLGFPRRNPAGMQATLVRLADLVETPATTEVRPGGWASSTPDPS